MELAKDSDDLNLVRDYLEIIFRNTDRFEVLVNDLIDQQRIEEGRLTIKRRRFELKQQINNIIDEMRPLVNSRKQHMKLVMPEEKIHVFWDEARFQQLIINLLSNASKYSEEDTLITVTVEKHKDDITISITDEGYGFTEEEIEKTVHTVPRPSETSPNRTIHRAWTQHQQRNS